MGSLPHLACRLNCTQLMMQLFNIYFYFRCLMSEYLPHPFAAISKIMVNRHGKPWSLSHSLPLLFCLLKLKFAVLHWCKCKFLMFTSNKSKVFTCVNTVWPRVKADQKMPYYFCIRVLLRTVPHWQATELSETGLMRQYLQVVMMLFLILSQWLFLLEPTRPALLCKAAHKGWLSGET